MPYNHQKEKERKDKNFQFFLAATDKSACSICNLATLRSKNFIFNEPLSIKQLKLNIPVLSLG